MAGFSWFRWLRSLRRPAGRTYRKPRKTRRDLQLELLETRLAPATYTWKGGTTGTDGLQDWSLKANWVNGVAPTATTSADNLVFSSVGAANGTANDDIAKVNVGAITISATGYTIESSTDQTLILGKVGTLTSPTGGGGLLTVSGTSGLKATIASGMIIELGAGTTTPTFTQSQDVISVGNGATLTIAGQLAGASNAELISNGVGTLVLSADNSGGANPANGLNGPVLISAGILSITNANALGNSSATTNVTTVASASGISGTLQVDNSTNGATGTFTSAIKEKLILNGAGSTTTGALLYIGGAATSNVTWSGNITMDSDTTFGAINGTGGSALNISGVISDNSTGHTLTKQGSGKIIFSGANTFRQTVSINNGILDIQNSRTGHRRRHRRHGNDRQQHHDPSGNARTRVQLNRGSERPGQCARESQPAVQCYDEPVCRVHGSNELLVLNGDGFADRLPAMPLRPKMRCSTTSPAPTPGPARSSWAVRRANRPPLPSVNRPARP